MTCDGEPGKPGLLWVRSETDANAVRCPGCERCRVKVCPYGDCPCESRIARLEERLTTLELHVEHN